jgi:hypothetical protein
MDSVRSAETVFRYLQMMFDVVLKIRLGDRYVITWSCTLLALTHITSHTTCVS